MLTRNIRSRLVPRSLRRQFMLAVAGLSLLILAGGVTALYALRVATSSARQLSEDRLLRLQEAQELVQRILVIERESYQLPSAGSDDATRGSYADIVKHLEEFDRLAGRLASGEDDIEVLSLHQSSQSFRNTVNIVAQLRESVPPARPEARAKGRSAHQFEDELRRQAAAMVAAAQLQSDRYAQDYRQAIRELAETSTRNERWVTVLLTGSLVVAWLIAQKFLGGHVLARLELISRSLRRSGSASGYTAIPVQGADEIAEMARAVEEFQEDRRKLVQRTTELEAANEELEELSYAMSHDLRTPLRALDGFSRMLLEKHGAGLGDDGKRMLKVLRDNARHVGRLVDDILRYLALGRQEMKYSSVDLSRLASELFKEMQAAEPGRHLRLEVGVLPPAWADGAMIRQVLQNLLSNAVKFSPTDAETLIEVGGAVNEKEDIYYVRDRGVGFDMRYAHKLFRVFERVHPTGQYEGTAMGLAIVKRVIDRHGGRVWAEGREGEGATFHFALPHKAV
jgi:two-component system NtrC family sensor kinase